ncbi:unnamed protein product [Lymnaea stagnalis]|uniref:Macro domain-containing protein n=1 Tax=Lymnaea stagnalis TaxID=6523 RepID=A0AAV2HHQ7_LYMST
MGNNQSGLPDEDDGPRYDFHENVLREAQSVSDDPDSNLQPPLPAVNAHLAVHEDEQYFSAEEGDSVVSITPPRTRPESSSGEDFSEDNSTDDDETTTIEERSTVKEQSFLIPSSPSIANRSYKSKLTVKKSCGQCNVSTFQEHDSIGPELEIAKRGGDQFSQSPNSSRGSESLISLSGEMVTTPKSPTQKVEKEIQSSPFIPIGQKVSPGKRKASENVEEFLPPSKQMVTRASSKRKRIGYFESSESESGDEGVRKFPKKGKYVIKSPKKARRSDRDSLQRGNNSSDSDVKVYQKRRRTRNSRNDEDSESESSEDSGEKKKLGRRSNSKFKKDLRRKKKRSDSSDSSESNSHKKKRHKDLEHSDTESEDETDKEKITKSKGGRVKKNSGTSTADRVDAAVNTETDLISQNIEPLQTAPNQELNPPIQHCNTLKMGNNSVRNLQGKILFVRLQDRDKPPGLESAAAAGHIQHFTSTSSSLKNAENNLSPEVSAFAFNRSKSGKITALPQPGGGDNLIEKHVTPPSQVSSVSEEETGSSSPFKNIVLTPPKTARLHDASSDSKSSPLKRSLNHMENGEEVTDMDVDESQLSISNQSNNPSSSFSPGGRLTKFGEQQGNTTAERFKSFWSQKKKKISTNLKSLFSKSKSTPTSPNTSKSWQSFLSSSPAANRLVNSFHSPRSSMSTFLSSDGSHQSFVSSSPRQHVPAGPPLPNANSKSPPLASFSVLSPIFTVARPNQSATPVVQQMSNASKRSDNHNASPTGHSSRILSSPGLANIDGNQQTNTSVEILQQILGHQVLNFRLANFLHVCVCMGDIAEQKTSSIVNWTDGELSHIFTPCSKSIAAKAGALMRAGCSDYIEIKGGNLEAPDVLTTAAGGRLDRSVEAILHVVAPNWVEGQEFQNRRALLEVYANCLRFADERLGLESISFPLIGEGLFPADICVQAFFDSLLIFLAEHSASLNSANLSFIQLVIFDANVTNFAADLIQSRLDTITQQGLDSTVAGTYGLYYGGQTVRVVPGAEAQVTSTSPPVVTNTERALSGRPRVKRPRL